MQMCASTQVVLYLFIIVALDNFLIAYHEDRGRRLSGSKSLSCRSEQEEVSAPVGS
jgi:hypothetical protein